MTVTTTAPAGLSGIHAELLDCVQSNLAVLADTLHGPGTHLALGAHLRFRPRAVPGGLPTVEPALEEQLAEVAPLGLTERARWRSVPPERLAELASAHGRLYVVADSFDMSWLPYHGRRHMEHSYLVEAVDGAALITDAYHNPTPWGLAAPGQWRLPWAELPVASLVVWFAAAPDGPEPVAAAVGADPAADYLAAYRTHPDRLAALSRLTVETWLLARARRLHARFLDRSGVPEPAGLAEHLRRWERLAEQAFLALRRVERGRPEPERLLADLGAALAADREIFTVPAASDVVAETVAEVVGVELAVVLAVGDLGRLPGFDSFRVLEIVETLEERLGVEFDADDLVPENLHSLDNLRRLAGDR